MTLYLYLHADTATDMHLILTDRTTQDTPLFYNNFPLELPFKLCQSQSFWSVLYILNFIDIQYEDSLLKVFFPSPPQQKAALSLLPSSVHVLLFSASYSHYLHSPDVRPYLQRMLWRAGLGWEQTAVHFSIRSSNCIKSIWVIWKR